MTQTIELTIDQPNMQEAALQTILEKASRRMPSSSHHRPGDQHAEHVQARLAYDIRAVASELFRQVDKLYASHDWPHAGFEHRADQAVKHARAAFTSDNDLPALLEIIQPILDEWWPGPPSITSNARNAVDHLRIFATIARYGS